MVINYSKWDALELSDDSDIEVHPNVDKRSFIRAKQNQIHMERDKRRHEIKTLKYERIVNDGLLERIDALVASLKSHAEKFQSEKPGSVVMQALMETGISAAGKDKVSQPPEDVHYKEKQPATYSEMMASLVDQVQKDFKPDEKDQYNAYLSGIGEHKGKVEGLQKQLLDRLQQLEKEEGSKITSDSIRDGFNTSSVAKSTSKEKPKARAETVEVLNPGSAKNSSKHRDGTEQSSGADADIDESSATNAEGEDDAELTPVAKAFGQIKVGNWSKCLDFISQNREVVSEKNHEGLLMEAFNAELDGKPVYAKQCVHQALLLQYCRTLGKDGVGLFFKRITTKGHNAQKVFADDVDSTYNRIRTRSAEIKQDRAENPQSEEAVEQIQLHAVEPGSQIHINVPQANSGEEVERNARTVFESFPPGLQRALESGSLDRVNDVLGKMSVSEAEEVVENLGEAGMLSMEKGVIDATTEEGQEKIKELEREATEEKLQDHEGEPYHTDETLDGLDAAVKEGQPGEIQVADVD